MPDDKEPAHKQVIDEPPPFLGTWPRVYIMVIGYLTVLIALFYLLSKAFAPGS